MPSSSMRSPDVVILVHGIRTHAHWFPPVQDILQENGFIVSFSNYGQYGLDKFLLPISYFRKKAQTELYHQIRATQQKHPNSRLSIIAHSFGTYLVANVLRQEFDLHLRRVIFVGSVVRYNFPFEHFATRFKGDILNEVGTRDPWPALAESVTTGYGSTGTYGFKRPHVFDAWSSTTHSAKLSPRHCSQRWLPFLTDGTLPSVSTDSNVPWWIRVISAFKIKHVIVFLLVCIILRNVMIDNFRPEEFQIRMYPGNVGWSLSDNDLGKNINKDLGSRCKLEEYFGIDCRGNLGKYITKRDWKTVDFYDSRLNAISFPNIFEFKSRNPLEFWYKLSEEYPTCIKITDTGRNIALDYLDKCNITTNTQELRK